MKRILLVIMILNLLTAYKMDTGDTIMDTGDTIVFGESQMGRCLEAFLIQGETNSKTAILLFTQHGWEDTAPADGQALVDCAYRLAEHYKKNPQDLGGYQLVIVPLLNPDGLYNGTNNWRSDKEGAFGRCYQNGVDPNRDWLAFEAPETRAMRQLILQYEESLTLFVDFHGYINQVYGSKEVGDVFKNVFGFKDRTHTGYNESYAIGYVHSLGVPYVAMIEYKNRRSVSAEKTIQALNQIFLFD